MLLYVRMRKLLLRILALTAAVIVFIQAPLTGIRVNAATNPGAGDFVTRLYNYALCRQPDAEGYEDWTNKLLTGQTNGAEVARGIITSQEAINIGLDDSCYVDMLYHVFFNRAPDDAGMQAWTAALADGADRGDVMMGFVNSVEWADYCANAGIFSGSTAEPSVQLVPTDECYAYINNLNRSFYNTTMTDMQINALANDLTYLRTTCRQAAYDIIFNENFIAAAKTSSPGKVVDIFYRAFEGRAPVAAETYALVNAMNGNINLDYLFNYFVNRQSFMTSCVNRGLMPGTQVVVNTAGITDEALTSYFDDAAFIGNSVTAGFPMYFSANGRGLLGNVQVYARVSYSFLTDMNSMSGYMLQYNDIEMQAASLINMAGVQKVFICMGTNDLVGTEASVVYDRYIDYINGIISSNPGIRVFIVSTPPRVDSTQTPGLTNEKIDELNEMMSEYCANNNLDFIDINTPLKNNTDSLYANYSSDGYVHMNNTGYGVWAGAITSYVRSMLAAERHIYRYRGA